MRNVGRMREKVILFEPRRVSDGALGFVRDDLILGELYARIQPASKSEIFRYQHLEQEVTHKVTIRTHPAIRQGQHLRWGDIELYIVAVTPIAERNEFQEVICRQGGNL